MGAPLDHAEPDLANSQHTVLPGQTLYSIANSYGLTPAALASANGIQDPGTLKAGSQLTVPEATPISTPPASRPREGRLSPPVRSIGKAPSHDILRPGDLDWPLRGVLYARFGKKGKELHDGIDLAAPRGTPIRSARDGTVLYAGEQRGYGLIAIVEHDSGLVTLYAHNNDLRVKSGQKVRRGQVIATVGESGRTSGPHLHFEVRKNGVPVDPLDHLGPIPQ